MTTPCDGQGDVYDRAGDSPADLQAALDICHTCPAEVMGACYTAATDFDRDSERGTWGLWGRRWFGALPQRAMRDNPWRAIKARRHPVPRYTRRPDLRRSA